MKRRRSATVPLNSRHIARGTASCQNPEFVEFQNLLGDIRLRLSRLSRTYGEPMNFRFQQAYAHPRPYCSPARVEAEALYRLVQTGKESLDSIRGLIEVPPHLEVHVRDLNFSNPDDQRTLLASLRFRKQVLKEFETLVVKEQSSAVEVGKTRAPDCAAQPRQQKEDASLLLAVNGS